LWLYLPTLISRLIPLLNILFFRVKLQKFPKKKGIIRLVTLDVLMTVLTSLAKAFSKYTIHYLY
jgi:hypothetical protein